MPGSLSVVAVPEPGTWALMLAGMHLGGFSVAAPSETLARDRREGLEQ
jgi:hypothetical protein